MPVVKPKQPPWHVRLFHTTPRTVWKNPKTGDVFVLVEWMGPVFRLERAWILCSNEEEYLEAVRA